MTKDLTRTHFLTRVSNSMPVKYAKHMSIALIVGAAASLYPMIPDGISAALIGSEAASAYALGQGAGIWASYPVLSSEEAGYCSNLADKISKGEVDSALYQYVYNHEELPLARDVFEGLLRQRVGDPRANAIIDRCLEDSTRLAVETGSRNLYNIAEGAAQLKGDFLKASELGYLAHPDKQIDYKKDILDGLRYFLRYTETDPDLVDNILDKSGSLF